MLTERSCLVFSAAVLSGLLAAGVLAAGPGAEEVLLPSGSTTEEVKELLMKSKRSLGVGETRGISRTAPSSSTTESSGTESGQAAYVSSQKPMYVSVRVFFEYDSDELTPDAKSELDRLGEALASPEFKSDRWRIEGHTDASGPDDYNQRLSERRAASVYRYLVSKYGLDPTHLETVGKGERELYDQAAPHSGVNRRVRMQPLGES